MEIKKILLIEDNPGDARLVEEYLMQAPGEPFEVIFADCLEVGLKRLREGGVDAVLCDLGLPDGKGIEVFERLFSCDKTVPIVVLTGTYLDEELGLKVVQAGAQDYLVKEEVNTAVLVRALRYAIERKHVQKEIIQKIHELEVLNKVMMDREKKILELKETIEDLHSELGKVKSA